MPERRAPPLVCTTTSNLPQQNPEFAGAKQTHPVFRIGGGRAGCPAPLFVVCAVALREQLGAMALKLLLYLPGQPTFPGNPRANKALIAAKYKCGLSVSVLTLKLV